MVGSKSMESQLTKAVNLIFEEGNPSGIKAMLHVLGLCETHVRLPLIAASADLQDRIRTYVRTLEGIHA